MNSARVALLSMAVLCALGVQGARAASLEHPLCEHPLCEHARGGYAQVQAILRADRLRPHVVAPQAFEHKLALATTAESAAAEQTIEPEGEWLTIAGAMAPISVPRQGLGAAGKRVGGQMAVLPLYLLLCCFLL
jgi:hypothetical protein